MKIVMLNLADTSATGDAHTAAEALRIKYKKKNAIKAFFASQNKIIEYPLFELYKKYKGKKVPTTDQDVKDLQKLCKKVDKVFLSIHGPMKSVAYGVMKDSANVFKGKDLHLTVKDVALLMQGILAKDHSYKLTLVMCFGARSDDFDKDHKKLKKITWNNSFAFKLYSALCTKINVRMTARTGELQFNPSTGKSEVQSESAIQGDIEKEKLDEDTKYKELKEWYYKEKVKFFGNKTLPIHNKIVTGIETTMLTVKDAGDKLTALEKLEQEVLEKDFEKQEEDGASLKLYLHYLIEAVAIDSKRGEFKGKFGKLVYSYKDKKVTIISKYDNKKIVFQGPPAKI